MAETGKGVTAGKLAINVQKRLTRAQEKVNFVVPDEGSHGETPGPGLKPNPATFTLKHKDNDVINALIVGHLGSVRDFGAFLRLQMNLYLNPACGLNPATFDQTGAQLAPGRLCAVFKGLNLP